MFNAAVMNDGMMANYVYLVVHNKGTDNSVYVRDFVLCPS